MPILKQWVDSSTNFVSLFSFMKDNSSILFWLKQYILCSKGAQKKWRFLGLSSAWVKIHLIPCVSILKWQVNSSSNFASFFIFMTHNSSVNFKLILFLPWIKGSHHYPNIVFRLYGTKDGLFEGNLFWVGQYDHPQPLYWRKNYFNINIT